MPTKYDVFAELIELAPCKAKDLPFKTPIYNHLKSLIEIKWIKKSNQKYVPIKNKKTISAFNIIKYCLKNGLDYNKFFSKNTFNIIKEIISYSPNLRPNSVKNNKDNLEFLHYLENNQFILISKKRPKLGIILKHQIFENISLFNEKKLDFHLIVNRNLFNKIKNLKSTINPFDDQIFSYLSGSAGLEGSTITIGETRELILNDIYPNKPQKDIQMVKNLNEALNYIFDNLKKNITTSHIKEINKIILFSLHKHAGKYKISQNKIQGNPNFKTAPPKDVEHLMKDYINFLEKINSTKKCFKNLGKIHNEIQRIHPFADGNSRTTRMIVNWILMKFELPILIIKMGCFDEYMSLTKLSKKRSDEELTILFHQLLLHESLN
jgi:hypothetical protein